MLQIGICDDEPLIQQGIKNLLNKKYTANIHCYEKIQELEFEIDENEVACDILLMDIRLEKQNGISLVEKIRKKNKYIKVIYITGYAEFITDVFDTEPTSFLLKPIQKDKLYQAVDRAILQLEQNMNDFIEFKQRGKLIRIPVRDILYVESEKRNLILHQQNTTDIFLMKLSDFLEKIPERFLRCHQSFAVNMDEIKELGKQSVTLMNGEKIAVSRRFYSSAKEQMENYLKNELKKE